MKGPIKPQGEMEANCKLNSDILHFHDKLVCTQCLIQTSVRDETSELAFIWNRVRAQWRLMNWSPTFTLPLAQMLLSQTLKRNCLLPDKCTSRGVQSFSLSFFFLGHLVCSVAFKNINEWQIHIKTCHNSPFSLCMYWCNPLKIRGYSCFTVYW